MEVEDQAPIPEPVPKSKNRRTRSITIFIVVSLLNVGLLVLLWTLLLTPAKNATPTASDPLIGRAAPNFTLAALGTYGVSNLSLSNFKGKPVMLNVWSSTCGPCIAEAPFLQSQWQQVRSHGVVFLGIDFQDTQSGGLRFLQQHGITYPNVLDATGSVSIDYGVTGTPESIFINRQGRVVSRVIGPLTAQTLQSNLQLITR
jgi:cytochrome c biogenesis protein CcmG/thiol:disulfide interchange protein DsbE